MINVVAVDRLRNLPGRRAIRPPVLPSCGELLASVAGAVRPVAARAATKRAPRTARATATPSVLVDVAPVAVAEPLVAAEPVAAAMPIADSNGRVAHGWDDTPDPLKSRPPIDAAAEIEAARPIETARPFGADDGEPRWPGDRPAMPLPDESAWSSVATAPGAYVPPVIPALPAGPPAPAREWAGHVATNETTPDAGARAAAAAGALVDAARLPDFVGWLAVAGSALSAVGFLLPWGQSVIGASGIGYFDRWGLAGPFHPLIVLGLLAILVLAFVRNPVPLWVRVGLPGLGLGALLLGLVWPYLLGLRGTGPGALVVTVGAILLIVAGVVALVTDRHAIEEPAV